MLDAPLLTAFIAAGAALAGSALGHWGALRLQAQRFEREHAAQQAALLRQQQAEFLGWVLLAQVRIEALLPRPPEPPAVPPPAESAATAARQAYAVALLSLPSVRPLAKAFYQSTAGLQLLLESDDVAAIGRVLATWRQDLEAIEAALASGE